MNSAPEFDSPPVAVPVSVVVPVYNERESLPALFDEVSGVLGGLPGRWEIVFVDDGSQDGSADTLFTLAARHRNVRVVQFRRNFGKAAALDAGFRAASGRVIVTMDADLQDDPAEIPRFLEMLDAGCDVVSGWKQARHDPLDKTLPSRLFNAVVSRVSGLRLNDFNCGFKAYRAEAVAGLRLYGELHRFIPVLLHWRGFRVGELPVNHRPRRFGRSKYGLARLVKGALDLAAVILNTRYAARPLHIFGAIGILLGVLGFLVLSYLTVLWFAGSGPIGDRPLLLFGLLLVVAGMQFLSIGLLGEFIQHTRMTDDSQPYVIRATANLDAPPSERAAPVAAIGGTDANPESGARRRLP